MIVSTPDVVALRGVRRLRDLWRRLQVRDDDQETLVLLNQASRKREVQPDLARKVVGGRLAETTIPAAFASLEAAVNTGSPARLEDQKLRGAFESLAAELEAMPANDEPEGGADGEQRGLLSRLSGERGQASVEFAGILPLLLIVVLLLWQIGLVGYTFILAGHAAREGARELSTNTQDEPKDRPYADEAQKDLPEGVAQGLEDRPPRQGRDDGPRAPEGPVPVPVRRHAGDRLLAGGRLDRGRARPRLAGRQRDMSRLLRRLRDADRARRPSSSPACSRGCCSPRS